MKIRTIEICISLMIILCVGFILFFVAHQLAKKQDRLSTAEKNQISDTKSMETEQVNHQNAPDKVVLEPQSVTPITRKVVPDSQADSHIKRKPQTVSQSGDQPGANTEKDVSSNRTISTKKKPPSLSDPPETKPEIKVQKPIEKGEVIQYETVRDEKPHPDYSLMKKRKQDFGIDKSLDLIVRSDENVQVGDAVAPIKKIAERLQLEEGRIIENDISGTSQSQTTQTHTQMNSKNKIIETDLNKSFQETNSKNKIIKTALNMSFQDKPIPDQSTKMPARPPKKEQSHQTPPNHQATKPHSDNDYTFQAKKPLSRITKEYDQKRYQRVKKQSIPIELDMPAMPQDENEFVPAYSSIEEQSLPIDDLLKTGSKEPNDSRYSLTGSISPETRLDIYPPQSPKPYETSTYLGIRVVYPGANIWDIHFDLLKDYFQHKGVTISPLADEPKKSGESTGVGKILKFSEQLVNIYNLETQSFENNLNVIHPMTVIVVYNMSQIFGILDDIDYSVIDRIEFDGESLWIPSVQ